MNVSNDGISTTDTGNYALQTTVSIAAITAPISFVIGFILNLFQLTSSQTLTTIVAIAIGFALTSFFFLKKAFSALAYDVAKKGITESLRSEFNK